eukprot:363873-Chlamydomonas_euryale.AAC.14
MCRVCAGLQGFRVQGCRASGCRVQGLHAGWAFEASAVCGSPHTVIHIVGRHALTWRCRERQRVRASGAKMRARWGRAAGPGTCPQPPTKKNSSCCMRTGPPAGWSAPSP